ncbi:Hypothetical protein NTJ_01941 [Nesidiocoris tenuis]|uniref:Uncharacterized protein n=1 Tax=Nesidiocoris tenuis TaxID=355587 RepID=A0ABN7ACQ7_9HEMI|nr:Hypothetical protein NTJ_01941 [Nesidiocoris tenuis]
MKASLFIAFLAIYGCVAQSGEQGQSGETPSDSGNDAKLPSFSLPSVGKILSKFDSTAQDVLKDKQEFVGSIVKLVDNAVQGGSGLAGKAIDQGATLSKDMISGGSKLTQGVVTDSKQVTDKVFDMVGKFVPIGGKTISKYGKAISGFGYNTANKVVDKVEKGATSGVTLGNEIGKKVTEAIGIGSTFVKEGVTALEDQKVKLVSAAISKGVKGTSAAIKGMGDGISSIGAKITESATLEA